MTRSNRTPCTSLEEITKRLPVGGFRKPRDVDELGVVVEVSCEAGVEHTRQLVLADDGELRVPSRGVQNEHLLVIDLRVDGAREQELREHHDGRHQPVHVDPYQSNAAVNLMRRGVRTASGCSHGPSGTKVLLYVKTAFEFSAL